MSTTPLLDCVELEPARAADAAVIWLHGLGADGHDFPPIVPELGLPADHGLRFLFPHAPSRPVTINQGYVMPAWYDIVGIDVRDRVDAEGIEASAAALEALIARERERGIATERILLAGFSQGGVVANHVATRYPERLMGLIGLSTYVGLPDRLPAEQSPTSQGLPAFLAHGLQDPMVPFDRGEAGKELLERIGLDVEWHSYPMQHQVCLPEIQALGRWIAARLAE